MNTMTSCRQMYRFGFNGQEKVDEIAPGHTTAEYWEYDSRLGRRWETDPVVKLHESPYATFANNPIWFADPDGADSVVIFDQANNPDNRTKYTALIYVVKSGQVFGPYAGSSYPNNDSKHNTLNAGWHDYNNESGHKGGTKKGLNIVDSEGNRTAPGTSPSGTPVTMEYVNIHSGVPKSENNGTNNRGSAGCPTLKPEDAADFFKNFTWTNTDGTKGTSTGQVGIFRGESNEATGLKSKLEFDQAMQSQYSELGTSINLNSQDGSQNLWNTQSTR